MPRAEIRVSCAAPSHSPGFEPLARSRGGLPAPAMYRPSLALRGDVEQAENFLLRTYLKPDKQTLEAGTGGGRLLLALAEAGFTDLYGFDFVPELVAAAQARDVGGILKLAAQDATRLGYADEAFDQIVYLQQVLCFIESQAARRRAMAEAFRVLRPGG